MSLDESFHLPEPASSFVTWGEESFFFKFVYLFIYLEGERVGEGQRERMRERESQAASTMSVQGLTEGSNSQTMRA